MATRSLDAYGQTERISRTVNGLPEEVEFSYDPLGRVETRTEPEGVTTWTWDTAPHGIGQLHTASGPNHVVAHGYDDFGRPDRVDEQIFGTIYTRSIGYDRLGRVQSREDPTGVRTVQLYNSRGYLSLVADDEGTIHWTADALDADGALRQMTYGNGVTTWIDRDPLTRRPASIRAGLAGGSEVLDLGLAWDDLGRLASCTDGNRLLAGGGTFSEEFTHDALDRIESSEIVGGTPVSFDYSPGGRIESRSDVGSYHYGENGAGPDQLTSLSGATVTSFEHDDKGNVESGLGRSASWTSYDKPGFLANASVAASFDYGVDRRRIRQVQAVAGQSTQQTTYVGGLYEEIEDLATGAVEHHHYVMAGGVRAAMIVTSPSSRETRYLHTDHLRSVAAVTDEQGALLARYFYDTHGRSVNEQGEPLGAGQRSELSTRGYTDHEHVDDLGLIHANARVLDPLLAQFLSVDPLVGYSDPRDIGAYAYARNNLLIMADPTGMAAIWGIDLGAIFFAMAGGGRDLGVPTSDQPNCDLACRNSMKPDIEGTAGQNSDGY